MVSANSADSFAYEVITQNFPATLTPGFGLDTIRGHSVRRAPLDQTTSSTVASTLPVDTQVTEQPVPSDLTRQPEGMTPSSPVPGLWLNDWFARVNDFVQQPDGKIVIVGDFLRVRGTSRSGVARLNTNGSLDTSFLKYGGGVEGVFDYCPSPESGRACHNVRTVVLLPDGKLVISGDFTHYSSTRVYGVARLNRDGSLDRSLKLPELEASNVSGCNTPTPLSSGKILVAFNPCLANSGPGHIIRYNADGSLDKSFNWPSPGLSIPGDQDATEFSTYIGGVVSQPDGKIIVSGSFGAVGSVKRTGVARFNANGSLDTSFVPAFLRAGTKLNYALASLTSDGKVLVGWSVSSRGKTVWSHARLHSNGKLDTSFSPASNVMPLSQQPNGSFIATTDTDTGLGEPDRFIVRLKSNGTVDKSFKSVKVSSWAPGMGAPFTAKTLANGSLMVAGYFPSLESASGKIYSRHALAAILPSGDLDPRFIPGR